MKLLSIVAALALTSSSAMALDTVMGLKGRFDYIHTKTDNNPGETSSGVLTTSFLELVTDAKLNDTTTAKLTLDFQPQSSADNGLTNLVDEAYLTKDFGHGLTVMVGKQAVMAGGRENDYSARDLYITSQFQKEIVENITGVSAGYSMEGQNLFLQYLQQTDARKTPLTDKKIIGAAYYGEFKYHNDDKILPILSYHKQGTSRVGAYDNIGSAALRITMAKIMVEADYDMLKQEKLSTSGDAELNTIVAHIRYAHENFQPFAKFITEKGKKGYQGLVAGSEESKRTAWEAGLEYMPNKDEDMRYHVVYNNSEAKRTAPGSAKIEEQKIYAGIAFNYNILK